MYRGLWLHHQPWDVVSIVVYLGSMSISLEYFLAIKREMLLGTSKTDFQPFLIFLPYPALIHFLKMPLGSRTLKMDCSGCGVDVVGTSMGGLGHFVATVLGTPVWHLAEPGISMIFHVHIWKCLDCSHWGRARFVLSCSGLAWQVLGSFILLVSFWV